MILEVTSASVELGEQLENSVCKPIHHIPIQPAADFKSHTCTDNHPITLYMIHDTISPLNFPI